MPQEATRGAARKLEVANPNQAARLEVCQRQAALAHQRKSFFALLLSGFHLLMNFRLLSPSSLERHRRTMSMQTRGRAETQEREDRRFVPEQLHD